MGALGIVAALAAEARPLAAGRRRVHGSLALAADVTLAVGGVGRLRAGDAARQLLADGARALVSWGTAGGLDPALEPGRLVLAERVLSEAGEEWAADAAWLARIRAALPPEVDASSGAVFASSRVLAGPADKSACFATTGALAVDMESAAVAESAARAGVPFVVIRVVCDAAGTRIPHCALKSVGPDGRLRPLGFLRTLARDPRQLRGVLEMDRSFRRARKTMERVVGALGPRLAAP